MNKFYNSEKYRSLFIPISILIVFIAIFYLVGSIYTLNNRKPHTIVLNESLFSSKAKGKELSVSNVLKLDVSYHISNSQVLNNNSIVFTTYEGRTSKVSILNLEDNALVDVDKRDDSILGGLTVSKNREQLIYTDFGTAGVSGKTFLYNTNTKDRLMYDDSSYSNLLLSSNKYIGASSDYLFLKDLNTNRRENLLNIADLNITLNSPKSVKSKMVYNFETTTDESTLYFLSVSMNSTVSSMIFGLNIQNKELIKYPINGTIYDIKPLDDGNLLISGSINENNGLFIYNIDTKNYKNLVHGTIGNIDVSPDRKRIAYSLQNEKGNTELYAALFNGKNIESATMLFSDSKYNNFLKWSEDSSNLFYVSEASGGSSIYRFNF